MTTPLFFFLVETKLPGISSTHWESIQGHSEAEARLNWISKFPQKPIVSIRRA